MRAQPGPAPRGLGGPRATTAGALLKGQSVWTHQGCFPSSHGPPLRVCRPPGGPGLPHTHVQAGVVGEQPVVTERHILLLPLLVQGLAAPLQQDALRTEAGSEAGPEKVTVTPGNPVLHPPSSSEWRGYKGRKPQLSLTVLQEAAWGPPSPVPWTPHPLESWGHASTWGHARRQGVRGQSVTLLPAGLQGWVNRAEIPNCP